MKDREPAINRTTLGVIILVVIVCWIVVKAQEHKAEYKRNRAESAEHNEQLRRLLPR